MPTTPRGSVVETGHPGGMAPSVDFRGVSWVAAPHETTDELTFPANIAVFDRMRREDGQVGSLLRAIRLSILGTGHRLDTDGVDPAVAKFVRTELGLDDETPSGSRQRRRRQGIVLHDHLREALNVLPFGFMPFEQVYEPGPPTPEQAEAGITGDVLHLRKLGPRYPRTVREIRVGRDGGLEAIVQSARGTDTDTRGVGGVRSVSASTSDVTIPVDRLVMYVLDREGADWTGNSLLRQAYKHWLIKDVLYRVGAQAVERNGMGFPVVEYDPKQMTEDQALEIAANVRTGSHAGAAVPKGQASIKLLGVEGTIRDELPLVEHHDRAIGRSALSMFLNLGHDNGARSLGDTFVDVFIRSCDALAEDVLAEVVTEHIIRDLVEVNFGPDEPYPVFSFEKIAAEAAPTVEGLKQLADANLIDPTDPKIRGEVSRRFRLPVTTAPDQPPAAPGDDPVASADETPGFEPVPEDHPIMAAARELVGRLTPAGPAPADE